MPMNQLLGQLREQVRAMTVPESRIFYGASAPPDPAPRATDKAPFTAEDFGKMAKALDVPSHWPQAIAQIETNNKPFTVEGHPVIRFEGHHWRKRRAPTPAGKGFDKVRNPRNLGERWDQFLAMAKADRDAAILSHSFGAFQIMGFNYKVCGFTRPADFAAAMQSKDGQAAAFVRFVQRGPALVAALRNNDERTIAKHYNGPRYERNRYHLKLANWRAKLHGYEYIAA